MNAINTGTFDMGKVVFLYRSLAYRNAAADMLRKARKLPRGAERSAARRYATALRDLAQTEAWLVRRVANESRAAPRRKIVASRYPAARWSSGELVASNFSCAAAVAALLRVNGTSRRHNR